MAGYRDMEEEQFSQEDQRYARASAANRRGSQQQAGRGRRRSSTKPMPERGQDASSMYRARRQGTHGSYGYEIPASRRVQYRSQSAAQYSRSAYTARSKNENLQQQISGFATAADKYRARQPQKQAQMQERIERPVSSTGMIVRVAIIVVLLLVLLVRFAAQGGVFGQVSSLEAQVSEQQAQLTQLSEENAQMQSQIDSRQATIDAWNEKSS